MVGVVIEEYTLELSSHKSITGGVYFQIGDTFFPDCHWNDFIIVILTWWNKSIKLLETSSVGTSQNFDFMDGPFYVHGVKKDSSHITLNFIRRKQIGLEVIASLDTEIISLKKSITKASKKVMGEVDAKQWMTDDIEELKKQIK
ncbi:hypothetical protein PTI45_00293 [Paenibacillus nuruki]|uniref:Uncharacterized protein n=1 Tax=Paenibacillus nuruki TaxID=1886670 RepID=A0A1E3L939_9BACL|nr:hypothetical protein [Paenibacillus nuruki]ODP30223.1 hypothetical protein PTI45_00293 [Paenibacillus nuruki]